jgi:hypothetical protein
VTFATRNFLQSANAARLPGGLIDDTGLAASWRPKTLRTVMAAHTRWLAFLALNGLLDPNLDPGDRLTPCRLRAYIKELAELGGKRLFTNSALSFEHQLSKDA